MTKAEWLALPLIVRVWRVLFCHHPWDKSRKIGVVRHAERDHVGYHFVVNVRQCGRCCEYFLDAGLEDVSDE